MIKDRVATLLPEEDVLEDPDDDDEVDPTVPGDLWYRMANRGCGGAIVYSRQGVRANHTARKDAHELWKKDTD